MINQTVELLKECNSGCKMAMNSMNQIMEYVVDEKQAKLIDSYAAKHKEIENRIKKELAKYDKSEEEPGTIASAMSWLSTEMKMMLHDDKNQVAKIMMDGCNMGIQSVGEYMNKYQAASSESRQLAKDIIKVEEDFLKDMEPFL